MTVTEPSAAAASRDRRQDRSPWWDSFPWWAILLGSIIGMFGYFTFFVDDYNRAWKAISPGIGITITTTLWAFLFAMIIGLIAGFGRVSRNVVARNLSRTYIEFIRGVPTLPLLFFIAFVIVPDGAGALGIDNKSIDKEWRGIAGLAMVYGGYIAEVIRGGIQSIDRGQMEAGRSLGLSYGATMRSIVLPQAVRNVLPPLGNDFVAMLKDSSLLSLLAIREITQNSKLYVNTSFQPRETYIVLTFTYIVMVIALSLALTQFERWMTRDRVGAR
ncbi:MAG: amino acid ABC transporter permease [Acidimicrobiales bacterium]